MLLTLAQHPADSHRTAPADSNALESQTTGGFFVYRPKHHPESIVIATLGAMLALIGLTLLALTVYVVCAGGPA